MDKFCYSGKAEIKHLNIRKEGPDDEKVLAVDIKLQCVTDAAMLDFFHEGIRPALFTDAGAVKNLMLKPLSFSNSIMNCDLEIIGHRFGGVEVGKFSLEPKDGNRVTMVFSVSIQPSGDEVAQLSEFVMDEIDVSVEPQPELDFGGVKSAIEKLDKKLADDGISMTVSDGAGKVIGTLGSGEADDLYEQAVAVVRSNNRASISLVQRHLRVGYNRAARLLEEMEKRGVVRQEANGEHKVLAA